MRGVGIRDVAAAAGVSVTTVSHVLNEVEGKRVNPETRERVWKVARELGYSPNPMARSLRTRRSQTVGMLSDEIATTPFAGKLIVGVQDVVTRHGGVLILTNSGGDTGLEKRETKALVQRRVDGVLKAAMYHQTVKIPRGLGGVPLVLLNAVSTDLSVSSVVPDEIAGGCDAALLLLDGGHRRLGMVNNVDDIPAKHLRLEGFRSAVLEAGPDAGCMVAEGQPNAGGGYQAAWRLLSAAERPTGIFCFNDRMAVGAYRAAAELGFRVPDDVSLVGFDNLEVVVDGLYPGLTTIALPHYEMGVWAATELYRQIEAPAGEQPASVHERLRGEVIHRASIASPPRS